MFHTYHACLSPIPIDFLVSLEVSLSNTVFSAARIFGNAGGRKAWPDQPDSGKGPFPFRQGFCGGGPLYGCVIYLRIHADNQHLQILMPEQHTNQQGERLYQ